MSIPLSVNLRVGVNTFIFHNLENSGVKIIHNTYIFNNPENSLGNYCGINDKNSEQSHKKEGFQSLLT